VITVPKPATGEPMYARKLVAVLCPGDLGGAYDWAVYLLDLDDPAFINADELAAIEKDQDGDFTDEQLAIYAAKWGHKVDQGTAIALFAGHAPFPRGRYRD
jgi:hypothetical protein